MSRRLAVVTALVFCLVAATVGSAAAGADDDVLPLPESSASVSLAGAG